MKYTKANFPITESKSPLSFQDAQSFLNASNVRPANGLEMLVIYANEAEKFRQDTTQHFLTQTFAIYGQGNGGYAVGFAEVDNEYFGTLSKNGYVRTLIVDQPANSQSKAPAKKVPTNIIVARREIGDALAAKAVQDDRYKILSAPDGTDLRGDESEFAKRIKRAVGIPYDSLQMRTTQVKLFQVSGQTPGAEEFRRILRQGDYVIMPVRMKQKYTAQTERRGDDNYGHGFVAVFRRPAMYSLSLDASQEGPGIICGLPMPYQVSGMTYHNTLSTKLALGEGTQQIEEAGRPSLPPGR